MYVGYTLCFRVAKFIGRAHNMLFGGAYCREHIVTLQSSQKRRPSTYKRATSGVSASNSCPFSHLLIEMALPMLYAEPKIKEPLYFSGNLVLHFKRNGSRLREQRYAVCTTVS